MKDEIIKDVSIKNNSGMATIEVVVIVPISLTIIMLLIWTGILFYNRNVLDQAASRAAIVGAQHSELGNDEICEIVMNNFKEYVEDKIVLLNDIEISVNVSYANIEIELTGSEKLPESIFFGNVYKKRIWEIYIKKEAARLRPSVFVRTVSRIKNGLENHTYNQEDEQTQKQEIKTL